LFDRKKVLITGGTGSLGKALTKRLLETNVETIRIFSRDEWKQVEMNSQFSDERLRFFIGDVRDKQRLKLALENVDIVIHTAALKNVPVIEYNPFEGIKTNVIGSQNVVDICLENNIEYALAISTDKAVSPFNTYGATKLLMEKLFISANNYKGKRKTKFLTVRYGNVLGSRGSLLPILVNQIKNKKKLTITDPKMTRFNITMNQSVDLILRALQKGQGGEVFVPKLKAYETGIMKDAITEIMNADNETQIINIRAGEKMHESLISKDEIRNTSETDKDYVIEDTTFNKKLTYTKSSLTEQYSSDSVTLLTKDEIKEILLNEKLLS